MKYICIFLFSLSCQFTFSQADSILVNGTYRRFILHLPTGYNPNTDYPIVLNLHGLGSSAFEQQLYSQFDFVANDHKFIVAYGDAVSNNWDLFGNTDTEFLSDLVDTLRQRYSMNNCLFSMGMSQGGFMSYKFACEFPKSITAIASVTGTMTSLLQLTCDPSNAMPVMHFHGTADQVVPYTGTFGIPPIEETIQWWVNENNCSATPAFTSMPDIDPNDGSTAELYHYTECNEDSEVIFYKIIGGGHSWPGAFPIPSFGSTNQDVDASELIGDFFAAHCTAITAVDDTEKENTLLISPNPATDFVKVEWPEVEFDVALYDIAGRKIYNKNRINSFVNIDCSYLKNGIYLLHIIHNEILSSSKKIVISK